MDWQDAEDIKNDLVDIVKLLNLTHIDIERIYCYRTKGSKTRAYARTWSFPKIFQRALSVEAAYVIEVLSQHYDNLDNEKKKKYLFMNFYTFQRIFQALFSPIDQKADISTLLQISYLKSIKRKSISNFQFTIYNFQSMLQVINFQTYDH